MHEMLTRLFTITDDVDVGVFLQFDGDQSRVELALSEIGPLQPPLRPQHVRFGEPSGDGFGRLPATLDGNSMW